MIKGGKRGDIVYLDNGFGPKARIIARRDLTSNPTRRWRSKGIYFWVLILEETDEFKQDATTLIMAKRLSRRKR